MKKYKMTAHDQFMQYFTETIDPNEKDKPGVFTDRKTKKSVKWLRTPTIITQSNKGEEGRIQKTSLVLLGDMNSPTMWQFMTPTLELMRNSFSIDPKPYVDRAIHITSRRKGIKSILLTKQKQTCPICSNPLII